MNFFEELGLNGEKIPRGYGKGTPKEVVKASDDEIRKKALINETKKEPQKIDEGVVQEIDTKISMLHNLATKPAIVVAPVPTKNYYPTPEEYINFHNDFTLYRKPLNFTIKDDILTVTNSVPNGRPLTIGMYAIISILGEKFDAPVMENIDIKKGYRTLPDFDKLDAQLKQKWWDYRCCFTDLYQYSVPRVEKECMMYHELMALPLFHRIQFLEWEKSLLSQKVANGIIEGLKERDAQLEQIRKDYLAKYENEKTVHRTETDRFNKETRNYRTVLEQLKARNDNLAQKLESITEEHGECYQKIQDAESKTETAVREVTNLKIKLTELEKKVIKYEVDPWSQDSNSDAERPVYFNKVTDEIISYPENFKKSYKLSRKEGEVMVYTNDKDKEFKVPETLIIHQQKKKASDALSTLVTDDKKAGTEKEDGKVRRQYIFDTISKNGSLSVVEIEKKTGIPRNLIYEDTDIMFENGLITKDEDNNDKYTTA
ncbi:MAG: hypothetical protein OIN86_04645 [Candidatus Methanoperedens sp.]|nr:hypothetical protein [Candidatus Methanoperedens sp.]CAG0996669.1 hypothetical protein METP1_02612 [Methanosarcinales archaeon]